MSSNAGSEADTKAAVNEPEAAGFVLAGGRSSRMGRDKALVELYGQPLIAHGLDILRGAALAASLAGGEPSLARFAPLIPDRQPDLGPLSGICCALASTTARWAVFLSVDAPFIPSSLLTCLLRHAQITERAVTLSSVNGFPQTFPAVVDRAALPWLERELGSGRGGCFAAFQSAAAALHQPVSVLAAESLVQCGQIAHPQALPAARWFMNLNTAEELRRAEMQRRALTACVTRIA